MTTPLPPRSRVDRIVPVLASLLGVAHLVFGATKLAALPPLVQQFRAWQLPPWMMYFVGVAQVLGGLGLLVRKLRLPASFAMGLVMIGATVTLLATGHEAFNAPLTILLTILCFVVAGHRLPQLARELVAEENEKSSPATTTVAGQ